MSNKNVQKFVFLSFQICENCVNRVDIYENYEIKQPGFSDPRVVPHIDLKIHTDVNELESYNTINSGILCNQF